VLVAAALVGADGTAAAAVLCGGAEGAVAAASHHI
jgi:hypothetical protein